MKKVTALEAYMDMHGKISTKNMYMFSYLYRLFNKDVSDKKNVSKRTCILDH